MGDSVLLVLVALTAAALVAWFATTVEFVVRGTRGATSDSERSVALARRSARVHRFVTLPAALAAVVAGWGAATGDDRSLAADWWLGAALALWVVAFLGSALMRGAECRRIVALALEPEPDDEDVRWRTRRILLLARGEVLLLVVVGVLVIAQPT